MFLVLVVVCIVMLYPFAFMIINSLSTETQYLNGSGFSTSSWSGLFSALPVGSELLNSTLICAGSIAIILIGSSAAGFAFAKLHYRRQNVDLPRDHRQHDDPGAVDHHPGIRQSQQRSAWSTTTWPRSWSTRHWACRSPRS